MSSAPVPAPSGQPSIVMDAEWVAALLHKFAQPLTALHGSLELGLEFSTTAEEYRQAIEEAMVQADRMVRLKRVLMELTGRYDLAAESERLALGPLIEAAAEDSLPVAERMGVAVQAAIQTKTAPPLYALVNGPRTAQALTLLLNATIEYSESGSVVSITCEGSGSDSVTTFSNSSGAIPEIELSRMFDPFFVTRLRSSGEDASVHLALAAKILESAGGCVRAENLAPSGFRLAVRLPLVAAPDH